MTAPERADAPGGDRPTVVLVDDHALFRSGVRAELAGRVDVLGEAEDVDSAVRLILARAPEVVLLDVHHPAGAAWRSSRRYLPSVRSRRSSR